jgi:phosphate ABC transporter phosphate-binding protein
MSRLAARKPNRRLVLLRLLGVLGLLIGAVLPLADPAQATTYVPVSGAGSTWSQNALDQWIRNVDGLYGIKVNYAGTGSSDGRNQFRNDTVDFGVSEIPYGLRDGGVFDTPPSRPYAYMPIVAGGTSFMYNLKIGGHQVTNLRLSGQTIAKIFTGNIKLWNDPAIKADNPGLSLPARRVVPVVRSDGSGTTAQLTTYLSKEFQSLWDPYCAKAGRSAPCGVTSNFPLAPGLGFVAQSGSLGVAGYTAQDQSEGAITYVEYSYALNSGFPVVKMLNSAGYYVEPTAPSVAVALLAAKINTDASSPAYLTQILDGVYANPDPRTYPLSSYSYMIIPTSTFGTFNAAKGATLGAFAYYFLCEGQQQAPVLGYSPLPINLVQAGLAQVRRIPGVVAQSIDIAKCRNPTFSANGTNTLATSAPQPAACDKQGPTQCSTGTGGAKKTSTPVSAAAGGTGTGSGSTSTGGGSGTGTGGGSGGGGSGSGGGGSGTSGTGTTTGGGTATTTGASGKTKIDPDTGQAVSNGNGSQSAQEIAATPVSTSAAFGSSAQAVLMVLSALLLVGTVLAPPLISRLLAARRKP